MTKKMVNGVLLDMTAEEEKEFADLQKMSQVMLTERYLLYA